MKIQIVYVLDILGWNNLLSKILADSSGLELKVTDPGCYRLQYFILFYFFVFLFFFCVCNKVLLKYKGDRKSF